MPFLNLGSDITIKKLRNEEAAIDFTIENAAAVEAFLANEAMITFLTDPFNLDTASSGCRLEISSEGDVLTIARQTGGGTIMPVAYLDLLRSLKTYVTPHDAAVPTSDSEWRDMAGKISKTPGDIIIKDLARGSVLLGHPVDGDPEPPAPPALTSIS